MEGTAPTTAQVQGTQLAVAALRLHVPGLRAEEVLARLCFTLVELGLAAEARFEPVVDGLQVDLPFAVPVRHPDGHLAGVVECTELAPGARPAAEALADHAGAALAVLGHMVAVEQRAAGMRRVAEQLQARLLPPLPEVEATNLEVRYRAAQREARVGGDFYDACPLPDGRLLVVVGDVVGKGVEAAGRSSVITQTIRALALQGLPLDELLSRSDEQVAFQDPDIIATLWCGLYQPETGELAFASLGHPPALLLRSDGEPIRLELEGLPLGMRDLAPEPPECRTRLLGPRDLLVLYTDGVVEASGDFIAGQEALLEAVLARRDEPLAALVEGALDELLADAGHTDDAVMLLLRRR